ncbi:hypothetical protein GCM10028771_29450 [Nocardioides marmoraquaticus]
MWQEINVEGQACHWWQDLDERMITAMTLLVLLAVLSTVVWGYALVHVLRHDPRSHGFAPPRSHHAEHAPRAWYDTAA